MKKILPFILLAGIGFLSYSCDNDDEVVVQPDQGAYSKMRDVTGSFTNSNGYAFMQGISIENTDVVLVYRWTGNSWQQVPKTILLNNVTGMPTNRVFEYNFVFDSQNVQIRVENENFDLASGTTSDEKTDWLNNQKFRIVLVPALASKGTAPVDYSDYHAVIKYYRLNDSNVPSTKVN